MYLAKGPPRLNGCGSCLAAFQSQSDEILVACPRCVPRFFLSTNPLRSLLAFLLTFFKSSFFSPPSILFVPFFTCRLANTPTSTSIDDPRLALPPHPTPLLKTPSGPYASCCFFTFSPPCFPFFTRKSSFFSMRFFFRSLTL